MPLVKTQAEGINLADTFAFTGTVSGAGTRKLLRTITISSSTSSVDFVHGSNGVVLDSTHMRYEITIDAMIPVTNGANIRVYLSSDSGSSFYGNSTYNVITHRSYTNGSTTNQDATYANDYASHNYNGLSSNSAHGGGHGTVTFSNWGGARRATLNGEYWGYGDSYYIITQSMGAYESNSTTINAIRIAFSSGNIASGIFKLFGVL